MWLSFTIIIVTNKHGVFCQPTIYIKKIITISVANNLKVYYFSSHN